MLYEMVGIVRPGNILEVKEIVRTAGALLLSHSGVIRGITNWGVYLLPSLIRKKGQTPFHSGHHFVMRFDSSITAQNELRRIMGNDPRLLRFSIVKMAMTSARGGKAQRLMDVKDVVGRAGWTGSREGMS